jgi:vancomycin resistance protein YoaR
VTTDSATLEIGSAARLAPLRPWLLGFAVGLIALGVAAAGFLLGLSVVYEGRVLPGVSVAGVSVAGLDRAGAEARLRAALPALDGGHLVVELDGESRSISYRTLGRGYDVGAIVDAALAVGRDGSPLERAADEARSLLHGTAVTPIARYDEAAVARELANVAAALATPAVDATVTLAKDGHYAVKPSVTGLDVDTAPASAAIAAALGGASPADVTATLRTTVAQPEVTTGEAQAAALAATTISSSDLKVEAAGRHLTIPASTVRGWLVFDVGAGGTLTPAVDPVRVQASLRALASTVDRAPRNAGFTVSGQKVTGVVPAVEGQTIELPVSAGRIAALLQGALPAGPVAEISLAIATVPAKLSTQAAQAILPKMHMISSWTTRFVPSDHNFFGKNISVPTTMINGTVVAPGETFDFWKVVKISREAGFGPGGAIINGHTEPTGALGGGICSCSTTLFNAALRAGLQMGARANHYYYIDRYPKGLDATVFISDGGWTQDMTWTNDSPYPILIRGINTPSQVTFQLYSANLGRRVMLSTPIVKNYRPAGDSVQYTKSLAPGVRYRVEYPTAGFDSWVTRTVIDVATGKVIHKETYYSHYARITGLLLIGAARAAATPSPSASP